MHCYFLCPSPTFRVPSPEFKLTPKGLTQGGADAPSICFINDLFFGPIQSLTFQRTKYSSPSCIHLFSVLLFFESSKEALYNQRQTQFNSCACQECEIRPSKGPSATAPAPAPAACIYPLFCCLLRVQKRVYLALVLTCTRIKLCQPLVI